MSEEVIIRDFQQDDLNFILSTWLKSYRLDSKFTNFIRNSVFYPWHERLIKKILARENTRPYVACLKEDPFVILGYLITEGPVVHFAYVKGPFRRMGIFKTMMKAAAIDLQAPGERINYTHHTQDMNWLSEKYPTLNFHPYLAT